MTMGWFHGRRLEYNDTVTYRSAIVAAVNPEAPPQPQGERPYIGHIVDFTDAGMVGVRADGWWGEAPLYYVLTEDILTVDPNVDTRGKEEERQRDDNQRDADAVREPVQRVLVLFFIVLHERCRHIQSPLVADVSVAVTAKF